MIINIDDLQQVNGRYVYTFTPEQDMDALEFESDCLGQLDINRLQVELNTEATDFVPPEVYEGNLSGIFKDLREINLEMTDEANSSLWSKIKANANGIIRQYHNETISAEIVESADVLRKEISNQVSGISSSVSQVNNALSQEIRDRTGAVSQLTQRLDGIGTRVTNAEGNYSTLLQKANGIQATVSDLGGTVSSNYTQLKGLIDLKVTRDDVTGIIRNSGDSIMASVTSNIGQVISAINLSPSGVNVRGTDIVLDGNVAVNGDFVAKVAKIIKLDAGAITTGKLNVAGLIDTNAITADKLKVDQALFNKLTADDALINNLLAKQAFITKLQSVKITAEQINGGIVTALNGAMGIDLNQAKISFNQNATFEFNSSNNAMYRKRGYNTAFLHFNDESNGGVYAGLGVTSTNDGINSSSSGRFAGLRIFRTANGGTWSLEHGAKIDRIEMYGDTIIMKDAFNLNRGMVIDTATMSGAMNLGQWLSQFNQNFKHLINIVGRGDVIKTFNHAWLQSELDKWNIH
ncbi:gp58-like family protein [Streptococcus moroccensis]|uniref:Gp58-like domain-containing protein n=1 Tax=Streptococcus moroccensis TaxID=1451356 RepID=A0ABT9YQW1_9STRE|nr:gp58-like family protein [Streptococcus moroccensis]MDQ0221977.1 hypothetical protein [Streptococcus moroccensis]